MFGVWSKGGRTGGFYSVTVNLMSLSQIDGFRARRKQCSNAVGLGALVWSRFTVAQPLTRGIMINGVRRQGGGMAVTRTKRICDRTFIAIG